MGTRTTTELLYAVHRAHRAALGPRLAALGLHPGADLALVELLAGDRITHGELAERLGVRPPSVTKVVGTLERDGLVGRLADPHDARVSRIHLTAAGRRLRAPLRRAWREAESESLDRLSERDLERLRRLLAKVARS